MNIIKFIAWMILWILSAGIGFCVDDEDSQSSSEPTEEEQTFVDLQTVLFGTLPIVPESLNDQVEPPEDVQVTAFGAEGEEPPRKRQARESSTGAVVPVPFSRNLPPPEPTDASFDINGLIRRIMHRMHPEGDVGGETVRGFCQRMRLQRGASRGDDHEEETRMCSE